MNDSVVHIVTLSLVLVLSPHLSRLIRLPTAPLEIILGSLLSLWGIIDASEHKPFVQSLAHWKPTL